MKNTLTALLLFSTFLLTAQNWCPGGAAWHYAVSYGQTAGYQYWHNDGDTVVNGINCNIVRGTQYLTTIGVADTAVTPLGPVYTFSSDDTVYLFDTAFYPAYYFNTQAGDTIYTRNMGSSNLALVDSTGTMVFDGDTLGYYIFHLLGSCADSPALPFKVIERIGSTCTSFVPLWNCNDSAAYNYSLCNYSDSFFAVYPDSTANCTYMATPVVFTYHHLLDTANIWHMTGNGCAELLPHGVSPRSQSCFGNWQPPSVCYTGNDTLVDSIHYFILNTGTAPYTCVAGFIREDTLQGKVYFRDNSFDPEWLLYDFSMQVGDSVYLSFQDMVPSGYSGFWLLTNIATVNTPAGSRRAFYLTMNGQNITWLEGVGSPVFPVYLYYAPIRQCGFFTGCNQPYGLVGWDDRISVLTCYSHSNLVYFDSCAYQSVVNVLSYPYSDCGASITDSCDYGAMCGGVKEVSALSSVTILPNPAGSQVNVELVVRQADKFSIVLRDLQGKEVMPAQDLGWLNGGQHSAVINLDNLSPGFYLVECRTEAGSLYSKLVVQR